MAAAAAGHDHPALLEKIVQLAVERQGVSRSGVASSRIARRDRVRLVRSA
jgi:hypothetical protein